MRKIILFIHSSFNGVVTGDPEKDKTNFATWAKSRGTGSDYVLQIMEPVDTILLGRGTYEDLVRKFPPANASPLGKKINATHKIVVTGDRPLKELAWGKFAAPEQLVGNDIEKQIKKLKASEGGDIIIFGSPVLVRSLTDANLIDEYHIKVHPMIVNYGDHLFDNLKKNKSLQLLDAQKLEDSCLLAVYAPANTR
ncbi:MAG TPA: dihydrofolate reductase family protein [Verrucomicrobiae bacterium]|nr:dihydrofolate reductase family protein [Verrucomicrobiae bacterium]